MREAVCVGPCSSLMMCVHVCVFPFCVQGGGARERAGRERLIRDCGDGGLPIGGGGRRVQQLGCKSGKHGSLRHVRGELLGHLLRIRLRYLLRRLPNARVLQSQLRTSQMNRSQCNPAVWCLCAANGACVWVARCIIMFASNSHTPCLRWRTALNGHIWYCVTMSILNLLCSNVYNDTNRIDLV